MLNYSRLVSNSVSYCQKLFTLLLLLLKPYILFAKSYIEVLKVIRNACAHYICGYNSAIKVEGTCSPGYESVKELFIKNFHNGLEDRAQLCIYVNNNCVVDLYGTATGDENYGPDNVQVMFSSGKSIAAIVVALMVDRGLLDYDEKVSTYWPEFAKNGKDNITVADVMRHEGGLAHIRQAMNIYDTLQDNLKDNAMGEMIENCKPYYLKTNFNHDGTFSYRSYHSVSRGWIINEIVRRVDPENRTIGEIVRQDINIPNLHCGLNDREMKNTRSFNFISPLWVVLQTLLPEKLGKKIEYNLWDFIKGGIAHRFLSLKECDITRNIQNLKIIFKPFFAKKRQTFYLFDPYIWGKDSFIRGENPSASCNGSARGMAKLASTMANRGITPEGEMLMGDNSWTKMHSGPKLARDGMIGLHTNFTQGGINYFTPHQKENPSYGIGLKSEGLRDGFVGWMGFGGSVMQWHPELKIGFAYIPTCLHWYDLENCRAGKLQKKAVECARLINEILK